MSEPRPRPRHGRKLLRSVLPFILVTLVQVMIASVSLYALSTVRAYVGGESLWSKGQKDAIYFLDRYADTGDEDHYRAYLKALAIPLGDLDARLALERTPADYDRATRGFLQGENDPDDVPGLIWLFVHFRDFIYMRDAIAKWRATDPMLFELASLGNAIHADRTSGPAHARGVASFKREIDGFNRRITPLAIAFSESLGQGSRAIKALLTAANIVTTLVLIIIVTWHIRNLLAQRERFENALKAEKERAQVTLASIGDAVIRIDAVGCVEYVNAAAERLIGANATPGALLKTLFRLIDKSTGKAADDLVAVLLAGDAVANLARSDLLLQGANHAIPVSLVGTRVDVDDGTRGAVLVLHDMTSEQAFIDRLSWQASHDALTGLANRREFERRLETMLDGFAKRPEAHGPDAHGRDAHGRDAHGLMFLDLDQFKIVNDTCGHAAGDALLCQVTALLQKHLRKDDLLARLGGDEFGVLLGSCDPEQAGEIAEALRGSIQRSVFAWEGRAFNVTMSVGLVCLTRVDTIKEEVLRAADMACYMAKEKGRNRVQLHQPSDTELLQRVGEMAAVQRIHDAIEHDRFRLYAQAVAPLNARCAGGGHVEVLLRMVDQSDRLAPPSSFLPAANRFGLMPLIDRWVVDKAFAVLARSAATGAGHLETCAINISGASVGDPAFTDYLYDRFRVHGLPPSVICFEITETGVISDLEKANRFIREFQQLGCRFALDDFGTGMSSFAYLKHLPVDYLKIDGSFVKDMLHDGIDRAMIEMITRIARTLGTQTIAEFAESDAIVEALRDIGVDYAQGYAIERPRPLSGHPALAGIEGRSRIPA